MSDDDLFSRWSRRKRAVAQEEAPVEAPPAPVTEPEPEEGEEDEAAILQRLKLPMPETMAKGDDFSAFMAPGVPAFLRKRALRVLWGSNPVLANIDGLNDYDEDFTSPELTKKIVATGYRVGRGFVRDLLEDGGAPEENVEVPIEQEPEPEAVADADVPEPESRRETAKAEADSRPRRMRFET